MTATKTNERPGTRAQHRYARVSPSKVRVVLDLIRNQPVSVALEILDATERDAARLIRKVLDSAVANAEHNDGQAAEELAVVACYADEGPTLKRFRPRARGRASQILKRTCHITVIVGRMSDEELERIRQRESAAGRAGTAQSSAAARRERVARSRAAKAEKAEAREAEAEEAADDVVTDEAVETAATEATTTEVEGPEAEATAEEAPAEEAPAEEAKADEAPADEAPDDETDADETNADDSEGKGDA
jgi:large subunit ribosomal protein L22